MKILAVCGMGLGSGLLLRMQAEKALKTLGVEADLEEETLEVPVPPFTLQPLVENAVRHAAAATLTGATVRVRGDTLVIRGTAEQVDRASRVFEELIELAGAGQTLAPADLRRLLRAAAPPGAVRAAGDVLLQTPSGKVIAPRTPGQAAYVQAIRTHDLTFAIGGALGLSDKVLERAHLKLSFSKMTFPHQLMRLILLEQIFRWFKIVRGEPYHR